MYIRKSDLALCIVQCTWLCVDYM